MRKFEYPLARARRIRSRRARSGSSSLLLCAGLAFIFVAPDEGRTPGAASVSPTIEVHAAQAMAPLPRRQISLPIDRVMNAAPDVMGGGQAPDIWSTPLQIGEAFEEELAGTGQPAFAAADSSVDQLDVQEQKPLPSILFSLASLIDEKVPIEGERESGRPAAPGADSPAAATAPQPLPTFRALAGRWAPHPAACSQRNRTPYLPLTLDERGAKAGSASCSFRRTEQNGLRWLVSAACSGPSESWNAQIRLALAGDKLTWASERGTQVYTRCR